MENLYQPIIHMVIRYALWMIPIFMLITALKLLATRFKGIAGEALVGQALNKISDDVLHDIIIPDGKGGLTQLDHVLLTADGLLVVETKNYSGLIFGMPSDRQWTQKLGRSTHRFLNPLWQNELHIKAVQALKLGVPVFGRVVYTDQSNFPQGRPTGVSQLRTLQDDLSNQQSAGLPSTTYRAAWEKLKQQSRTDREARKAHLAGIAQKHGKDRRASVAYAMLGISSTWLLIMWITMPTPSSRSVVAASVVPADPGYSAEPQVYQPTTSPRPKNALANTSPRRIIGYREEWVAGRPLEECLGSDRELNENVMRCRHGYTRKFPIFNQ